MIITCPNCATRYQVPDAAISDVGRKVRCRSCRFTWFMDPEGPLDGKTLDPAADEDGLADDPDIDVEADAGVEDFITDSTADIESAAGPAAQVAPRQKAAPRQKGGSSRGGDWKGWLALAACLTLIFTGFYEYRQSVVAAWPATARLYGLVGLQVNALGIEFANLRVERDFDNGLPVLSVAGEVVNVTGQTRAVPRLRLGLRDRTEREIYHWTVAVTSDPLKANGRAKFSTRLAAPPQEAMAVFLRFEPQAKRRVGLLK